MNRLTLGIFASLCISLPSGEAEAEPLPDVKAEILGHEVPLPTKAQLAPLHDVVTIEADAPIKLLMFRRVDAKLEARIRALSKDAQVIMIATTPGSYTSGGDDSTRAGKARLLNAGASAALSWGTPEQIGERVRGSLLYARGGAPKGRGDQTDPETAETLELASDKKQLSWAQKHKTYHEKMEQLQKVTNDLESGALDIFELGIWGTQWRLSETTRIAHELGDRKTFWMGNVGPELEFTTPELVALRKRFDEAKRQALVRYHVELGQLLGNERVEEATKVVESVLAFSKADDVLKPSARRIAARATRRIEALWTADRPLRRDANGVGLTPEGAKKANEQLLGALDKALQQRFETEAEAKSAGYGGHYRRPEIIRVGKLTETGMRRVAFEVRQGRNGYHDPISLLKEEIPRSIAFANIEARADGSLDVSALDIPRPLLGEEKLATKPRPYGRAEHDKLDYASNGPEAFYAVKAKASAPRREVPAWPMPSPAASHDNAASERTMPLYLLGALDRGAVPNHRMAKLIESAELENPQLRALRARAVQAPAYGQCAPARTMGLFGSSASSSKSSPPPAAAPKMARVRMLTR